MKSSSNLRRNARILWAITANDLLAVLKNKNALIAFLFALLMVVFYRFFPALGTAVEPQYVLVYDAGDSTLVSLLETSQAVEVATYPSEEALKRSLSNGDIPELGLVIPPGFDQALASGDNVHIQGYLMNWVSSDDAAEQKRLIETEISRLSGHRVEVQIEENRVYPRPDSHGLSTTVGISLIYVILMIPLPILPHLFLEEKQSRTLDALRVSPASAGQIVAGKALSGLFYCLLGAFVALVIFGYAIVHWGLVLLTVICCSILVVAIGLWLGMRVENRGQMSILVSVAILPLILPVVLSLMEELFPTWLVQISRLIPTATAFTLFRLSTAGVISWQTALLGLVWISAWAVAILALVVLQVRRMDRQEEPAARASLWLTILPHQKKTIGEAVSSAPHAPQPALAPSASASLYQISPAVQSIPPSNWKMIWAITVKDLRTAIKNKLFLSILLGAAVMAGFNILLPRLIQGQNQPVLVVYDKGHSTILRSLAQQTDVRLNLLETQQEMENMVTNGVLLAIGLVLPPDYDQQAASGQDIELDGYLNYTMEITKAQQWADGFEQQLSEVSGSQVHIRLAERRLYPSMDTFGQPAMIAEVFVMIIFILGAVLVPLLFLEEKEAHTLDALLVSPAGFTRIVAGKALAGTVYCLVATTALIALNLVLFVHWEIVLVAVLLTTFFSVASGLLLGIISNNPTTLGAWGSLMLIILVGLTALGLVNLPGIPDFVGKALAWLPGTAALNLFRLSMTGEVPAWTVWENAIALLTAGLLIYLLVIWRIRRADR